MKNRTLLAIILGFTTTCVFSANSNIALAATLLGDWTYAIDSFDDSISGNDIGGTKYEIYATAYKQTKDSVFFAINTNLSLAGTPASYAHDGHISWGDLLLNFSGNSLNQASQEGSLFGIKFASNNESGVPELGIYSNVVAKELAMANGIKLENLSEYNEYVSKNGRTPSNGDLAANDPYFDQASHVLNLISSGTKIGDVNLLTDLSNLDLDFGHFGANGSQTIAFSVDRSLLPDGSFVYSIDPECDNDIIAGIGELEKVPEPSSILSFAVLIFGFGFHQFQQRYRQKEQN